jgi:hypothetical protein
MNLILTQRYMFSLKTGIAFTFPSQSFRLLNPAGVSTKTQTVSQVEVQRQWPLESVGKVSLRD